MTSADLDFLMQQEIDGQNTREDSIRLQEALRDNPAARRQFHELQEMARLLDRMERLDPPAGLARTIISALHDSRHESHPIRNPSWGSAAFWRRPVVFRFAYVFVAGVVLGVLGTSLIRDDPDGTRITGVTGALAPHASRIPPEGTEPIPFEYGRGLGTARVRRTADGISISVQTSAPPDATAELGLDLEGGRVLGHRVEEGNVHRLSSSDGAIRWAQDGSSQVTWYIATASAEGIGVQFSVAADGSERFHTNFRLPPL